MLSELVVFSRAGFEPFSSFLAMRSTSLSVVSPSCLIVLACSDPAGDAIGRARAVSRWGFTVFTCFQGSAGF